MAVRPMKLLLYLLVLCATGPLAVSAQTSATPEKQESQVDPFIRKYDERRAKNPEGLLFTVRLKENRKQFHHGEIIALELSFASSKPKTFTLDAATYDRSGRLHMDGFALDPHDGVVDPLNDYFRSGLFGFMMGGLRGIPDLTDKPYLIDVELNEWQRIDKPGHYRLYVVSSRVGRNGERAAFLGGSEPVISNVIEFDVLPPDKKWSTKKLKEIISALSKPGGDHGSACRALRFLGTTAAVTEMRKRFRGDDNKCDAEYQFGLIGSPHRELVIREMGNAVSIGDQPVTSSYIATLALLELIKREGTEPPYVAGHEQISQGQTQEDRRKSVYEAMRLNYLRQLVMAIPEKQGAARAASLKTLLDNRLELNTSDLSQWSTLLASLPKVFTRLPLDDQLRLLTDGWRPIASPAMVPVLREVFSYLYDSPDKSDPLATFNEFRELDLRSKALQRLYELSPEEGRGLIIEEIRRSKLRVNNEVLRSLPDKTLPELNTALLSKLEEANRTRSWNTLAYSELIERYATDDIFSRVRAVYESRDVRKWDCQSQAALLAYFLRVAPSLGAEYLAQVLAVREKGYPRCYTETLKRVADLRMSAEVEEAAAAALDDDDPEVVSQAAVALGEHGSADAEKLLWRRLEKLREALSSGGEGPGAQELNGDQEKIEKDLIEALTHGQAWIMDPEKLKRARDLCVTEKCRDEVDRLISGWKAFIYVDLNIFGVPYSFNVAHYRFESLVLLKQKLLQFPKGTVIEFKTSSARSGDPGVEEVFQELKSYLEDNGMSLKRE